MTRPDTQNVRPITEAGLPLSNGTPTGIQPQLDTTTNKQFVLWKDVLEVYKTAKYVKNGSQRVPFLINNNFEV